MDASVLNCNAVQPVVQVVNMVVKMLATDISRGAQVSEGTLSNASSFTFTGVPLWPGFVEVYLDGFRVVNESYDFGATHQVFEVVGNEIQFHQPASGHIKVVVDQEISGLTMPDNNIIVVRNEQGGRTPSTQPGEINAAYFCEPLILTEPHSGYVRLSNDHSSLVYIPNMSFQGYDSFSYTVITDRGQIASPKCVYVKVGNPTA